MIVVLGDLVLCVAPGLGGGGARLPVAEDEGRRVGAAGDRRQVGCGAGGGPRGGPALDGEGSGSSGRSSGDAVQVAKAAVHTDELVTQLAEFLKYEVGWRAGDVPALPGAPGWEPSAAGELEEGGRS